MWLKQKWINFTDPENATPSAWLMLLIMNYAEEKLHDDFKNHAVFRNTEFVAEEMSVDEVIASFAKSKTTKSLHYAEKAVYGSGESIPASVKEVPFGLEGCAGEWRAIPVSENKSVAYLYYKSTCPTLIYYDPEWMEDVNSEMMNGTCFVGYTQAAGIYVFSELPEPTKEEKSNGSIIP